MLGEPHLILMQTTADVFGARVDVVFLLQHLGQHRARPTAPKEAAVARGPMQHPSGDHDLPVRHGFATPRSISSSA